MNKLLENAKSLYIEGIEKGDYEFAINKYSSKSYTQHSTGVRDGKEGFIDFFKDFTKRFKNRKFDIIHSFSEGNLAFLYVVQELDGEKSWITMDIFLGDCEGKLLEHWDIISKYDKEQIKGNFNIEKNENNLKKIVINNIEVMKDFLQNITVHKKQNFEYENLKVHQILQKDNFVVCLSEIDDSNGYAIMQLFRFNNNILEEYWEVDEIIPDSITAKNKGKF